MQIPTDYNALGAKLALLYIIILGLANGIITVAFALPGIADDEGDDEF